MGSITEDMLFKGNVSIGGSLALPSGVVRNSNVASGAAIDADKLQHIHVAATDFGVDSTTAPSADVTQILFRADAAGTIRSITAVLVDTGTSTDVKFDVKKASATSTTFSTVLSSTIDFTHADADNTAKTGTVSSASLAVGDLVQAEMDYTSATGAAGPFLVIEYEV